MLLKAPKKYPKFLPSVMCAGVTCIAHVWPQQMIPDSWEMIWASILFNLLYKYQNFYDESSSKFAIILFFYQIPWRWTISSWGCDDCQSRFTGLQVKKQENIFSSSIIKLIVNSVLTGFSTLIIPGMTLTAKYFQESIMTMMPCRKSDMTPSWRQPKPKLSASFLAPWEDKEALKFWRYDTEAYFMLLKVIQSYNHPSH